MRLSHARGVPLIIVLLATAACGSSPSPSTQRAEALGNAEAPTPMRNAMSPGTPAPSPSATPVEDLLGRWTGVEGMYLDVSRGIVPGHLRLEMQWDLDHKGVFAGEVRDGAIHFERAGKAETLRPGTGAETGLKYLAGKTDCLVVRRGEGYCRG